MDSVGDGVSKRRFLIAPPVPERGEVILPPAEAEHARKVLRLEPGQEVWLLDGRGRAGRAVLSHVSRSRVVCRVEETSLAPRSGPELVICPGLLKGGAMDDLTVKLTELGAAQIRPFSAGRTIGKVKDAKARLQRWERLSGQALKQCGSTWSPEFFAPAPLAQVLAAAPDDALKLFLYEDERGLSLSQALPQGGEARQVWAVIGPEGGFSRQEVDMAREAGFVICGLPGAVLRAQTASLAVASVIRFCR